MNIGKVSSQRFVRFLSHSREFIVIGAVLATVFTLEVNAAFHGAAQGQDFNYHFYRLQQAAYHQIGFLRSFSPTDPPLYYLLAGIVFRLAGPRNWLYAIGIMNATFNVSALFLLYLVSRFLIQNKFLRVCLVCSVGFLPAFVITSVVLSGDAFSQLPCLVAIYVSALAVFDKIAPRTALFILAIATLFAITTKFIAISLIAAFCGAIALLILSRRLAFRPAVHATIFYLCATVPVALLFISQRPPMPEMYVSTASPEVLRLSWTRIPVRSVVFFRSDDLQLLNAPSHWQLLLTPNFPSPSFRNGNSYSYPGLLCLGTFTDLLNFFQGKQNSAPPEPLLLGARVGKRSDANQSLMILAMRAGSVLFICSVFSLPFFFLDSIRRVFKDKSREHLVWLFAFLVGVAWLAFIMCILPIVTRPYTSGYYLPRLVLPSIMVFALLFYSGLERLALFRKNSVCSILLCLVALEGFVHVSFLWMSN